MTLEQKVEILHCLIDRKMSALSVAKEFKKSPKTIHMIKHEYCTTQIVRICTLKPEKKMMARFLEERREEPKLPGI
jgi:hypothetical protein